LTVLKTQLKGTTLVELTVASFLLAILLTLTYQAMVGGVRQYQILRSEIEMQQDALALLARLSRETAEGHSATTWPDRIAETELTMPGGNPVGLVFLSPRNSAGKIELDPTTARPMWQKRVCFFHNPTTRKVYRSLDHLVAPSVAPPPRDETKTTGWFRETRPIDPLPGNVEDFTIQVGDSERNLRFNITLTTESGQKTKILQFLSSTTLQ
jgi:type II secretory pathway pseudopilin PulG